MTLFSQRKTPIFSFFNRVLVLHQSLLVNKRTVCVGASIWMFSLQEKISWFKRIALHSTPGRAHLSYFWSFSSYCTLYGNQSTRYDLQVSTNQRDHHSTQSIFSPYPIPSKQNMYLVYYRNTCALIVSIFMYCNLYNRKPPNKVRWDFSQIILWYHSLPKDSPFFHHRTQSILCRRKYTLHRWPSYLLCQTRGDAKNLYILYLGFLSFVSKILTFQ